MLRKATYGMISLSGKGGGLLTIHMCRIENQDGLEFWTEGGESVVISREEFNSLVGWVDQQFSFLGRMIRLIRR